MKVWWKPCKALMRPHECNKSKWRRPGDLGNLKSFKITKRQTIKTLSLGLTRSTAYFLLKRDEKRLISQVYLKFNNFEGKFTFYALNVYKNVLRNYCIPIGCSRKWWRCYIYSLILIGWLIFDLCWTYYFWNSVLENGFDFVWLTFKFRSSN